MLGTTTTKYHHQSFAVKHSDAHCAPPFRNIPLAAMPFPEKCAKCKRRKPRPKDYWCTACRAAYMVHYRAAKKRELDRLRALAGEAK